MRALGLTIILCLSTYLVVLTQFVNQNPNAILFNALNKQSLINSYAITGLMTTSISVMNYTVTTSVPTVYTHNESMDTYAFTIPGDGENFSVKLIITNDSQIYCENDYCSEADLSKLMAQRFAGVSAIVRINQLLNEHLISLDYKGFELINGLYCDMINANIATSSDSFINYIIDGEVTNLSIDFCLDKRSGLPIKSTINAGVEDGSVSIEFTASEVKV